MKCFKGNETLGLSLSWEQFRRCLRLFTVAFYAVRHDFKFHCSSVISLGRATIRKSGSNS